MKKRRHREVGDLPKVVQLARDRTHIKTKESIPESAPSHDSMLSFQSTYNLLACCIYFNNSFVQYQSPSPGMLALLGQGCCNVFVIAMLLESQIASAP